MGSMNDLGALPKGKKKKIVKTKEDDMKNKKIADELNDIYEVMAGVEGEMTSVDMGHKHEIKVDENGNGKTVSTLGADGGQSANLNDHVHEIIEGVIQESMEHSHVLSDEG